MNSANVPAPGTSAPLWLQEHFWEKCRVIKVLERVSLDLVVRVTLQPTAKQSPRTGLNSSL
jgi:hypothetical protein